MQNSQGYFERDLAESLIPCSEYFAGSRSAWQLKFHLQPLATQVPLTTAWWHRVVAIVHIW